MNQPFSIQGDVERRYCLCAALLIVEKGSKVLQQFLLQHWQYFPLHPYHSLSGIEILQYEQYGPPVRNPLKLNRSQTDVLKNEDITHWDITLLCAILQHSKAALDAKKALLLVNYQLYQSIWTGIDQIRNLRNNEYGHISEFKMDRTVFTQLTSQFQTAISGLRSFIPVPDLQDIDALLRASLPDDQIIQRAQQLQEEVKALVRDYEGKPLNRLEKWIDKFFLYENKSIVDQLKGWDPTSENNYNLIGEGPMINTTTRSVLTTLRSDTRTLRPDFGGREVVSGKLSLRIMPEDKTLPEISSKTELIVGNRLLMHYNYEIPDKEAFASFDPLSLIQNGTIGAHRWILGLDKDYGLGFEEFRVYYDSLFPGWVVEKLPTVSEEKTLGSSANKVYIFNGPSDDRQYERGRLEKSGDFLLLMMNDRIRFGRKYDKSESNHFLCVSTLLCDQTDQLPFEGLQPTSISGHTVEGRIFTKNNKEFVLPTHRGGFSMIYKAISSYGNQAYAFKVPFRAKYFDNLHKEVQILAKIGGFRSVIFLRDMFALRQDRSIQKKAIPVFKMDWAYFGSLQEIMIASRKLYEDEAMGRYHGGELIKYRLIRVLDIMIQVAEAMEFAHNHDVTHADLKPANVLVMNYRAGTNQLFFDVKVCDFNISSGQDVITNQSFASWGCTRGYRAPEQSSQVMRKMNLSFLTGRCDIWSLAILMIQLIRLATEPSSQYVLRDIEDLYEQALQEFKRVNVATEILVMKVEEKIQQEIHSLFLTIEVLVNNAQFTPVRELLLEMLRFRPECRRNATVIVEALRSFATKNGFPVIPPPPPLDRKVIEQVRRSETKYVFSMSTVSLQEIFAEKYLSAMTTPQHNNIPDTELFTVLLGFAEKVLLRALPVRLEQFLEVAGQLQQLISSTTNRKSKTSFLLRTDNNRKTYEFIQSRVNYYQRILRITSVKELAILQEKLDFLSIEAYRELSQYVLPGENLSPENTPPHSTTRTDKYFEVRGPFYNQYSPGTIANNHSIRNFAIALSTAMSYSSHCHAITFSSDEFTLRRGTLEEFSSSPSAEVSWALVGDPSTVNEEFQDKLSNHILRFYDLLSSELEIVYAAFLTEDTTKTRQAVCNTLLVAIRNQFAPERILEFLSRPPIWMAIARYSNREDRNKAFFHYLLEMIAPPLLMYRIVDQMMIIHQNASNEENHSAGLNLRDSRNRTPLFYACRASRKFVPSELVHYIATKYPEAISIPYLSKEAWYPLHQYLRTEGVKDTNDIAFNYFIENFPISISTREWRPNQPEKKGDYPLHLSVIHCDVTIVKRIHDLYPPAIYQIADGYQAQPLSYAIYKTSNYEIIDYLLTAYPQEVDDDEGIDFRSHRSGCAIYDLGGNLPLHVALEYEHGTVQIVSRFLQIFPEAVLWLNFNNDSVLDLVQKNYRHDLIMINIVKEAIESCQEMVVEEVQERIQEINQEFRRKISRTEVPYNSP